jgi:large subunit ribosomal protein L35
MPKIKTHRAAAKRFKATGSGKIARSQVFKSHLLTSKNKKRKRKLRQSGLVDKANIVRAKRMMPYI